MMMIAYADYVLPAFRLLTGVVSSER